MGNMMTSERRPLIEIDQSLVAELERGRGRRTPPWGKRGFGGYEENLRLRIGQLVHENPKSRGGQAFS